MKLNPLTLHPNAIIQHSEVMLKEKLLRDTINGFYNYNSVLIKLSKTLPPWYSSYFFVNEYSGMLRITISYYKEKVSKVLNLSPKVLASYLINEALTTLDVPLFVMPKIITQKDNMAAEYTYMKTNLTIRIYGSFDCRQVITEKTEQVITYVCN